MIYFDVDKKAYAYEIVNPVCVIEDSLWAEYAGTDKWDIVDGVFIDITDTEEYKAEQELKERERIAHLTCTKRVFALMLQELGISYTMLKELIATNEQAQLEWDLCVELERKNPLLDVMALQLGVTSEQLDGLFMYANGELTIDEFRGLYVKTDEELPANEIVGNEEPIEEEPVEEVVDENT